jgi:uncharacterized membrane protein YgaE (UPF0421/DUF939 family)
MSNQLSIIRDGASVQDLSDILTSMQKYVDTENDATMQLAIERINKKPSLLSYLFPNKYEREQEKMTVEKMKMIYQNKERFFRLYADVQYEVARKKADALIAAQSMDIQDKLTTFAQQKIQNMTVTIDDGRTAFLQRMKKHFQELEEYKSIPELHEPAYQFAKDEVKIYFDSMKRLLDGFVNALESKVPDLKRLT